MQLLLDDLPVIRYENFTTERKDCLTHFFLPAVFDSQLSIYLESVKYFEVL